MYLNNKILSIGIIALIMLPQLSLGAEVNILSERQEYLLRPFLSEFEAKTGIKANVVYLKKGSLERIKQQPGSVDAVLTVDISNLTAMSDAGLFQRINSKVVKTNVPANYRSKDDLWTSLTAREIGRAHV